MSRVNELAGLREQIQAGQRNRMEFVGNLARSGAEMKRANQAENKERRHNLLGTLVTNEGSRRLKAWQLQNARAEFVTNLARTVAELTRANQAENAAAHAAWHGARTTEAVSAKRGGKRFARAE